MCLKLICVGVSAGFIHVHTEPWPFTETQLVDTAKTFHFSQSRCWIGEKNSESEKKSLWVLLHHKALVVISKASPPAFICERRGSEQQSETHEAIRGFWSAEYLMRNVNEPIRHSVRMSCILSVDWFYLFFFLSWTTECFCFSFWWQILLVFPPPVRMARLCVEKDAAENLNTKQEVLRFQHFASFADSLTMNRSVSASTAFTDSLLRKGLRSLRGRKSEKGGGGEGENLKEMLLIHSETVNSQPDPTLPKLSLDLTPLISFFHTRSSVGLPSLWGSFFQPLLRKLICFTLHQSLLSLVPFSSLSPFYREPGWSLEEKLTGASADLPLILFVVFTAAQRPLRTLTGCECLSTADSGHVLLASRSTDIHFDAVLWLYLIFIVLYVYRGCMDLCRYCNLNSQTHIYGSY